MKSIRRPPDSGSRGTEDVNFIRCVDGQDTQLHKMWCLGWTTILAKSIQQREKRSDLEPWDSSRPITLLKIDVESPSLGKFLSTEVSSFWVSPILSETVDCILLKTCKIPLCPLVGETPIPPTRTGELSQGGLTACGVFPGVVLSLPVRLKCLGSQRTRALLHSVSVMTYFVKGVVIV